MSADPRRFRLRPHATCAALFALYPQARNARMRFPSEAAQKPHMRQEAMRALRRDGRREYPLLPVAWRQEGPAAAREFGAVAMKARLEPRLLSLPQAAAYCGVSAATFSALKPVIPIKIKNRVLYDRKAIDAWLDSLSPEAPTLDPAYWRGRLDNAYEN